MKKTKETSASADRARIGGGSNRSAPFEVPLTKAFDKLTSEIFIFLLAYIILLIGLAMFGSELANTLRNLLYLIPVLGVIAYVWLQQRKIVNVAKEQGINVKAGIIGGSARVVGVRGANAGNDLPNNVSVGAGLASGDAEVAGIAYGGTEGDKSQSSTLQVLADIFNQLNQTDQIKLIASAQHLIDKQQNPSA